MIKETQILNGSVQATQTLNANISSSGLVVINSTAIKDLGYINMEEYNGDYTEFMNTLTEEGEYKFHDDDFEYYVKVYRLENKIGQFMWYTEENFVTQQIRDGCITEDGIEWGNWDHHITWDTVYSMFAEKNHIHYEIIYIDTDIRTWLNANVPFDRQEYEINQSFDGHKFVFKQYYDDYTSNGTIYVVYHQEYFELLNPHKIYKRVGTRKSGVTNVVWGEWYVFEGFDENESSVVTADYVDNAIANAITGALEGSY